MLEKERRVETQRKQSGIQTRLIDYKREHDSHHKLGNHKRDIGKQEASKRLPYSPEVVDSLWVLLPAQR